MPAEKLTIKLAETAKPADKPYEVRDSELRGLLLRVQPSGMRTFYVDVARGVRVRLGRYPAITVEMARKRARSAMGDFEKHGAPAKRAAKGMTLDAFLRERYEPWVTAERKAGAATVAALRSVWVDLLPRPLTEITPWLVDKTKAARLKGGTMPATVNRDLGRIRAALAKAVEWDLLPAHPLSKVKRAKGGDEGRIRFLSEREEKALRKALDAREAAARQRRESGRAWRIERGVEPLPSIAGYCDHLTPMTLLALNTGMRRGELTSITWNDVNLVAKQLTVQPGYAKSGKARHIPLNAEAISVLKRYRKQHSGEGRLFEVGTVKKAWSALVASAKVSDFNFHDLRHTFASNLVMAGIDLNAVRVLLGHADIRMTLRYAHLAPAHLAAAVEKLVR